MLTPFEELDAVLVDFTGSVRGILGGRFVGAYVQGSFALGAGNSNSDCDFIIATTEMPSGRARTRLTQTGSRQGGPSGAGVLTALIAAA